MLFVMLIILSILPLDMLVQLHFIIRTIFVNENIFYPQNFCWVTKLLRQLCNWRMFSRAVARWMTTKLGKLSSNGSCIFTMKRVHFMKYGIYAKRHKLLNCAHFISLYYVNFMTMYFIKYYCACFPVLCYYCMNYEIIRHNS